MELPSGLSAPDPALPVEVIAILSPGAELGCHLTAIYDQCRSGDVGRQVGGEEQNGLCHLFRFTTAAKRDVFEIIRQKALIRKAGGRQASPDQARAHRVHANAIRSPFIRSGRTTPSRPALLAL